MKTGLSRFLGGVIVLVSAQASAETLSQYVSACKSELEFADADIPTNMNCNEGVRFAFNTNEIGRAHV